MSCAVKKRSGAQCACARIAELPEDVILYIFSKLEFLEKVNAGQVCKKWDRLLKASSAGARPWGVVRYEIDSGISRTTPQSMTRKKVPLLHQIESGLGRWIAKRAGAIKGLCVFADLSSGQRGVATMKTLESHLPLLAGCLSNHDNAMDLQFYGGSPFASPLLSSSDLLTFMCPMVKSLDMSMMKAPITESQFAAICELSMLERIYIHTNPSEGEEQRGLQEMTPDISRLVSLTSLVLTSNRSLRYIPEAISCLQQLKDIDISSSPITEVPMGLGNLASLEGLCFDDCGPLRFPPNLQGLKQLTFASLTGCHLTSIPEALCGIPSLTSLILNMNQFVSRERWPWWPSTLSRLTNLEVLDISESGIQSLPPDISGLQGLKELYVNYNRLQCLPNELSCLQSLENLQASCNRLATVPVSVLSTLVAITTIDLSMQLRHGKPAFKVSTSLLPILHPGLVKLELRQPQWDPLSLCHLGRAMTVLASRTPAVEFQWLISQWFAEHIQDS